MLTHRVLFAAKSVAQQIESRLTFTATGHRRVQRRAHTTHLICLGSYFLKGLLRPGEPSIDASS